MLLTKQNLFNLFKLLCIFIFHDAIFIYYTNLFIIPIKGMRHSRFSQFFLHVCSSTNLLYMAVLYSGKLFWQPLSFKIHFCMYASLGAKILDRRRIIFSADLAFNIFCFWFLQWCLLFLPPPLGHWKIIAKFEVKHLQKTLFKTFNLKDLVC